MPESSNLMKPFSMLTQLRRNHALEHATIHVLSERFPNSTFVGRSDINGFFLYGNVSTEAVHKAALEALSRLQGGEHQLAIHPNCGTNLVSAALLASGASFFIHAGDRREWRERMDRLPIAIGATLLALLVARPLGGIAQKHLTTDADPGSMEISHVFEMVQGNAALHRILTSS
jgi:hypothetical protein